MYEDSQDQNPAGRRQELPVATTKAELERVDQQQTEKRTQTDDELRAVYEGIADGLLVADAETRRFVRTNAAMCRMLGYTEEELLRLSVSDIHPADEVSLAHTSFQARVCGDLSIIRNRRVLRKDGSVFFADIRSARIEYDGRPSVLGIFRDMTERVEHERALTKERQVLRDLLAASDRERQLISYEIHDGLTQQLGAAIMQFQAFESLQATAPGQAREMHELGVRMLQNAMREARRLISGVRPPLLDDAGVVPAVESLIQEIKEWCDIRIECCCDVDSGRLDEALENAIYRIVQEGLTNACRYSQSERIRVSLVETNETIAIEVQDWGVGFDLPAVPCGSFGLESIRERARLLGGKAEIASQPGRGTSVRVQLPLVLRESG